MQSPVGRPLQPPPALVCQMLIVDELPAVVEALAELADGALHLALGLCPVGPTGPKSEVAVLGEPEELHVVLKAAPSSRWSLVMTERIWSKRSSLGTPPRNWKAPSSPWKSARMSLRAEELHPEKPRVAQHHQKDRTVA